MILSIDLDPVLKRRYYIKDFQIGGDYIIHDVKYSCGGWGVDVAKIVKGFNEPVCVTGFLGGRNGDYVEEILDGLNIDHNFVYINDETKTTTTIVQDCGLETRIGERSPSLSKDKLLEFYKTYEGLLNRTEIICAYGETGSLPQDIYRDLILMALEKGKTFLLNATGKLLEAGINKLPFLIFINREELEEYVGLIMPDEKDIIRACKGLSEKGARIIIVSLEGKRFIVINNHKYYKINVPTSQNFNSHGLESAIIGGLALSLFRNYKFHYMLKVAIACGIASLMEKDTGIINMGRMKSILGKIEMEEIKL